MKQFTLELNKRMQRPVMRLSDWHQFNVTIPDSQSCIRSFKIWNENGYLQTLCISEDCPN